MQGESTTGTHITFIKVSYRIEGIPNPRTKTWRVQANANGGHLGIVKWYSQWRQYGFFPKAPAVFNGLCLREIAHFCEVETATKRNRTHGGDNVRNDAGRSTKTKKRG